MGFLLLCGLPLLRARAAAQSEADPASWSTRPALRVLLGTGVTEAGSGGTFLFNGRAYRGTYQQLADGQIVNLVDLEAYLSSVVSREMPAGWAAAALQAQAICARSYVLWRSDPRRQYDLVPSELDQVYEGISAETPSGVGAVDSTTGAVLWFGGGYAQVAYSSCCGGHTESAADAWGKAAPPYLGGVACGWCTGSPKYRWTTTLEFDAVAAALASSFPQLGRITDLRIGDRDASGRVRDFQVASDRGSVVVGGSAFRRAVGSRVLPSLLLTAAQVTPGASGVLVTGGGLGHGVGLCQWGARGMALAQRSAWDILALYFPGTVVKNLS